MHIAHIIFIKLSSVFRIVSVLSAGTHMIRMILPGRTCPKQGQAAGHPAACVRIMRELF